MGGAVTHAICIRPGGGDSQAELVPVAARALTRAAG